MAAVSIPPAVIVRPLKGMFQTSLRQRSDASEHERCYNDQKHHNDTALLGDEFLHKLRDGKR